jgi:hypothetical protein
MLANALNFIYNSLREKDRLYNGPFIGWQASSSTGMKRDAYISGPHHFWVNFWCGLVVGAGLGAWISFHLFDNRLAFIASTAGISVTFACCCGRWGDSAWSALAYLISWWRLRS